MQLAFTGVVTCDVSALARVYESATQIAPLGNADVVEIRTRGTVLAICSVRSVATDNASGRSREQTAR